ncbi:MAG: SpoIIE family protein phosphatase, partial [Clostridia bacterium]|nr:SpoIIE family protein phosphatase [Clostridia bacterium]
MARERDSVFKKINGLAGVFIDMSVAFDAEIAIDNGYESAICTDIENIVCAGCPNRKTCVELCEGKNHIFMSMVKKGMEGKSVSEEDLPLFVISKCDRLVQITQCCESEITKCELRKDKNKDASDGSRVIAAQTRSIGKLLASLAADVGRGGNYDMDMAGKLIDELGYNNISCRNAAVFGNGESVAAALSIRRGDEMKKALLAVSSKVLGQKMRVSETCDVGGGYTNVMINACPKYDIVYGSSGAVKSGESVAGDTVGIRRLMRDRVLCILCDGMGSGKKANSESTLTLSALEGFYKSGFDDEAVLSLIIRYLSARGGEKFCALDICVIDLKEGS